MDTVRRVGHEGSLYLATAAREPCKEIAAVQRGGLRERVWRTLSHQSLEVDDVDLHGRPVERDLLAFEPEAPRLRRVEGLPQAEQRLAQALARLLLRQVPPEERGQLVARVGLAWRQRQVRQQHLGPTGWQSKSDSRAESDLESAEQSAAERCHRALNEFRRPWHLWPARPRLFCRKGSTGTVGRWALAASGARGF